MRNNLRQSLKKRKTFMHTSIMAIIASSFLFVSCAPAHAAAQTEASSSVAPAAHAHPPATTAASASSASSHRSTAVGVTTANAKVGTSAKPLSSNARAYQHSAASAAVAPISAIPEQRLQRMLDSSKEKTVLLFQQMLWASEERTADRIKRNSEPIIAGLGELHKKVDALEQQLQFVHNDISTDVQSALAKLDQELAARASRVAYSAQAQANGSSSSSTEDRSSSSSSSAAMTSSSAAMIARDTPAQRVHFGANTVIDPKHDPSQSVQLLGKIKERVNFIHTHMLTAKKAEDLHAKTEAAVAGMIKESEARLATRVAEQLAAHVTAVEKRQQEQRTAFEAANLKTEARTTAIMHKFRELEKTLEKNTKNNNTVRASQLQEHTRAINNDLVRSLHILESTLITHVADQVDIRFKPRIDNLSAQIAAAQKAQSLMQQQIAELLQGHMLVPVMPSPFASHRTHHAGSSAQPIRATDTATSASSSATHSAGTAPATVAAMMSAAAAAASQSMAGSSSSSSSSNAAVVARGANAAAPHKS